MLLVLVWLYPACHNLESLVHVVILCWQNVDSDECQGIDVVKSGQLLVNSGRCSHFSSSRIEREAWQYPLKSWIPCKRASQCCNCCPCLKVLPQASWCIPVCFFHYQINKGQEKDLHCIAWDGAAQASFACKGSCLPGKISWEPLVVLRAVSITSIVCEWFI